MSLRHLPGLPTDLHDLTVSLESESGHVIRLSECDIEAGPDALNPDRLLVQVDEYGATILYQEFEHLKPAGICHELLHIRRFWNERVPKIHVNDLADFTGIIARCMNVLDNALEHLIIIPLESSFGYLREDYWYRTLDTFWQRIPQWDRSDPRSARQNALMGYTALKRLFPDSALFRDLPNRLASFGLDSIFVDQCEQIVDEVNSKERMVSIAMKAIGIAPSVWGLKYLDVAARSHRIVQAADL